MVLFLFSKVFRYRRKDIFELELSYDDIGKCFILGGSIPMYILAKVILPTTDLLESAPIFKKDAVFRYLCICAEQLLKMPNIKKHYFPSLFLDDEGNLVRENLHFYNNLIDFLKQRKPTYISFTSAPYLCYFFSTVYLSALEPQQNKLIIHRIHRNKFERFLKTAEQKNDYVDFYRTHFLEIVYQNDGENFKAAIDRKGQVKMAFISYAKTIYKIG